MPEYEQTAAFQGLKSELNALGYVGGLLHENYQFADVLSPQYGVRHIPLAAFAQEPPSYRNASFGVAVANGTSGPNLVQDHKSLGAPQIFEINGDSVLRWKVTSEGAPELLEEVHTEHLSRLFSHHRSEWLPQRILQAKSDSSTATQLDFFDLGLIPLLESEARNKLHDLLSNTVKLAVENLRQQSKFAQDSYPPLFRLIFRLITSKVLADRQHPGDWNPEDPRSALRAVEDFYFKSSSPEPALDHYETQLTAWNQIRHTCHFQNLSVDSLAYVYENTLVSRETRKEFGIHSTPYAVAEYIVKNLPFELLDQEDRRVFEPFAGHSVFLVAAMQRMRELLRSPMTSEQRHNYFVERLTGIENDEFALEVGRLSLMLADYPNPDGWRLHKADALTPGLFAEELAKANIVLCNPPFEHFTERETATYPNLFSSLKPAEVLHRVLQNPPELLGFVLPRLFASGGAYRELRSRLGNTYRSIELLTLPYKVFKHSDAETTLLLSHGRNGGRPTLFKTGQVLGTDLKEFYATGNSSYEIQQTVDKPVESFSRTMWVPPLQEIWEATGKLAKLRDFAEVHRGIEYNQPLGRTQPKFVSSEPQEGFKPGLHRVRGAVEPFVILQTTYLDNSPSSMRTFAYLRPWEEPKIVVNASPQSRGNWRITASIDESGLICYQNFHGLWSKGPFSLEVLAAILNGPVANAFISTQNSSRHVHVRMLQDIPTPEISQTQQEIISSLVKQYRDTRTQWLREVLDQSKASATCFQLLSEIDAEVLRAYDFPPRSERMLLDWFRGHVRPGPVNFTEYFPRSFQPNIPWYMYNSEELRHAGASETIKRLPIIPPSPEIDDALSFLETEC